VIVPVLATWPAGVRPAERAGGLGSLPARRGAGPAVPGVRTDREPDLSTFLSPWQQQRRKIRSGPSVSQPIYRHLCRHSSGDAAGLGWGGSPYQGDAGCGGRLYEGDANACGGRPYDNESRSRHRRAGAP
jgi:hypothetical protein